MRRANAKKNNYNVQPIQKAPNTSLQLRNIQPRTYNQSIAFKDFDEGKHIALTGVPGSGKTYCALFLALRAVLEDKLFDKVIIVRSAVPSRDMGFLPGNLNEKMAAYEAPYESIMTDLFGRGDAYSILKHKDVIQFVSTSYLRGVTFDNSIVILDEFQNALISEIHTVSTRLGENCRLIVLGDKFQTDFIKSDMSGFDSYLRVLQKIDDVSIIEFKINDIVRSGFVKAYMQAISL